VLEAMMDEEQRRQYQAQYQSAKDGAP
jgi:hypothetical protein